MTKRAHVEKEPVISYSAKDLFGQVNDKLKDILAELKGKADLAAVAVLTSQTEAMDREIQQLKSDAASNKAVSERLDSYRRWAIATALVIAGLVIGAAGLILNMLSKIPH